ncbi:MAG: site-2 protease family protein [Verrucomicrobiales bacterium]|nr:site-2 protease family protein [Verrucomicrobiales bacterium]
MSRFYQIDSTRISLREYWWGTKSPVLVIGLLLKLLGIRLPASADDPNAESTLPFLAEELPPDVAHRFGPVAAELHALGFTEPVYHVFNDPGTRTSIYWATFRHSSGKYFARIQNRIWRLARKPDRGVIVMFFTEFADGTFLVSSSGKPDLATPTTVQMNWMPNAAIAVLWTKHEQLTAQASERKMIAPVASRDQLIAACERHHILLRDFNLERGVFRPRTEAEQAEADEYARSVEQARTNGLEHAEVFAELERLQTSSQKPNWWNIILVLGATLVLFIALGAARWSWEFTLLLIPVLLLHETGHWLAMRLFRYRNLRMFFIPLFGAAVTGQNWNVPGWKKALVSLAGPLPGLVLGAALVIAGCALDAPALIRLATLLLIVNWFNLLPVLPLDGGHVLQATLFCRNRWLDFGFRVAAVLVLMLLSVIGVGKLFFYLAIAFAIGLPVAFKLGKVTDQLRRRALPAPPTDADRIPQETAQAIITALKTEFPKGINDKTLASYALNVFETLNARPPSVPATIGLLALHASALVMVPLFGLVVLFVLRGGEMARFVTALAAQPKYSVECASWQAWPGNFNHGKGVETRNLLVATFDERQIASATFAELTNRLPLTARVGLFGSTLLLSLPAREGTPQNKWFAELQTRTTNAFVAPSNQSVTVRFMLIAPSQTSAANIARALRDYFIPDLQYALLPPWAPTAKTTAFAKYSSARRQWQQIERELQKVWNDPAMDELVKKFAAQRSRPTTKERDEFIHKRDKLLAELQSAARERLRTNPVYPIDPELLDLHARLGSVPQSNAVERAALIERIAIKLGPLTASASTVSDTATPYGTTFGSVTQRKQIIEIHALGFIEPMTGLPAFVDWVCAHGCDKIKYEFIPTYFFFDDESEPANP